MFDRIPNTPLRMRVFKHVFLENLLLLIAVNPAKIYLYLRKRCEICSKLTIKTLERRRFGVFMVNF